jgi:hypothetical protein
MAGKIMRPSGTPGDGFSNFDNATRADVGLPPLSSERPGDRLLRESCDHLPLFDLGRRRTASGGGSVAIATPRPAGREAARLSIVHKTSNPVSADCDPPARKPSNLFQVWKDASLAIFPGIPNRNPHASADSGNRGGKRGKVLTLSDASRRNLMIQLAKVNREAKAYTMALTLPGDLRCLTSSKVHLAFRKLCNRQTASRLFPGVAFIWKRELQERGALHYHLVIYGLENEETRNAFHRWIAGQWNSLVCVGLDDDEWGKHLRWHIDPRNLEAVRGNIARYFAKYLGKPLETAFEEIPGRWWGKVNVDALPLSSCSEMPLPERAAIFAHRLARKILQKRAHEARHRAVAKALGLFDSKGQPIVSQFGLLGMRDRIRNVDHRHTDWSEFPARTQRALDYLVLMPSLKGLRWGKAKRSKFAKLSRIRLISGQSPETAIQIMRFVGNAMKDWIERNPY